MEREKEEEKKESGEVDPSEFDYIAYLKALFLRFVKKYPKYADGIPIIGFYGLYTMKTYNKDGLGDFLSFDMFESKVAVSGVFLLKNVNGIKEVFLKK